MLAILLLLLFSAVSISSASFTSVAVQDFHVPDRHLQTHAALNSFLSTIELDLPDKDITTNGIDIKITELVCSGISVQDVDFVHSVLSKTTQRVDVSVEGIRAVCNFRWAFRWSFFSGQGVGSAEIGDNSRVASAIDFVSKNYDFHPPKDVIVSYCEKDGMKVVDMVFEGDGLGLIGGLMNTFEESLRGTVNEEVGKEVCEELAELSEDTFEELLVMVSNQIDPYLMVSDSSEVQGPFYVNGGAKEPVSGDDLSKFMNFQELDKYANGMLQTAVDEFDRIMGNGGSSNSSSGSELGVNSFIRENLLNNDGMLEVDRFLFSTDGVIFESKDELMESMMTVKSMKVGGLDSFKHLDLMNPIGKHTLQNELKLEELTFIVEVDATMKASSAAPDSDPIKENFTIKFALHDVEVDFSVFLGVNLETLGDLKLGSILRTKDIMPCIISAFDEATLTELHISVPQLMPPTVSGFADEGLGEIMSTGTVALFRMYEQVLVRAMPNFVQTFVQDMLNDFITEKKEGIKCPEVDGMDGVVDFRDLLLPAANAIELLGSGDSRYGDLFRLAYGFVDELMSAVGDDGLSKLNDVVVSKFTEGQSNVAGELFFPGYLFKKSMGIDLNGLKADILLGVSDIKISHIDSIGAPVKLLQPVSGEVSLLNNEASIGVGPEALQASFKLLIRGEGEDVKVNNKLELGISLESLSVILDLLAEVKELSFLNFPLRDVMNQHCWMAAMVTPMLDKYGMRVGEADTGLVLKKLAVAVAEARLHVNCIDCTSSLLMDMSSYLSTEEAVADTTTVANMLFSYGSKLVTGAFMQTKLDRMLNEAALQCPHLDTYDENFRSYKYDALVATAKSEESYGFLFAVISVIGVILVGSSLIYVVAKCVMKRRHNRWMKSLSPAQLSQLQTEQVEERKREKDLNRRMKAMICSKEIPLVVRLFIPIVILGNIALFLSGHLSLGGTVNISGSFAGQDFDVDGFFEFSMLKSTIDMWEAGATELAIMIAIFSGVWPYTKQLITLFAWFAPTCMMSAKSRGKVLHVLDVLAKWSMVDVFVLLLTLASFRISITSPDNLAFLPENLYSINLCVQPLWGLYANFLAQIISQLSSHLIIYYHRKTVSASIHAQENEWGVVRPSSSSDKPQLLRNHEFKLDYECSNKHASLRRGVNWLLSGALLALVVVVVVGCVLPSFTIEVFGLVGLAVESGNEFEEAMSYYSVFTLASMIMDQARYLGDIASYVGLGSLSSMLVITVFLVPVAQAACLLSQWFVPITMQQREKLTVLNEILSAWQYMEVYVLSIVITAWQISGVSEYMLNAYCGSLNEVFTSLSYFGVLKEEDAQCFSVNATVETASWLLVAASVLLFVLNHFVMAASSQKIQDENIPAGKRLHSDRWEQSDIESTMSSSIEDDMMGGKVYSKVHISPVPPRFTDYYFFAVLKGDVCCKVSDLSVSTTSDGESKIDVGMVPTDTSDVESAIELWDL